MSKLSRKLSRRKDNKVSTQKPKTYTEEEYTKGLQRAIEETYCWCIAVATNVVLHHFNEIRGKNTRVRNMVDLMVNQVNAMGEPSAEQLETERLMRIEAGWQITR